jgi:hypothetical protein
MGKAQIKPPRALKGRLKAVGKAHGLGSVDDVVTHFLVRGLKQYGVEAEASGSAGASLPDSDTMERVADEQGYASSGELVEHLLLRGLHAYEQAADDPQQLEQRLRGLGYID